MLYNDEVAIVKHQVTEKHQTAVVAILAANWRLAANIYVAKPTIQLGRQKPGGVLADTSHASSHIIQYS
jgi:hypothetical protein